MASRCLYLQRRRSQTAGKTAQSQKGSSDGSDFGATIRPPLILPPAALLKGLAKWEDDKLVFTDPNGTKPYSSKDIVEVLNKPLPENFYGDGKSPYHQRDALIAWTKDSDYIKNHTTSDKAYHFGRLLKRIEPMQPDEKL